MAEPHDNGHGGAFPPLQPMCPTEQQQLEGLAASYQSLYGAIPDFGAFHHP